MADNRIYSKTTEDPILNIGYCKAAVLKIDRVNDTGDIDCGNNVYESVPFFYNCPSAGSVMENGAVKGASKAFAIGDDVLVRVYRGKPSHITGFAGDIWPCISTPAHLFTGQSGSRYIYDTQDELFMAVDCDGFYDRYEKLTLSYSSVSVKTYINAPEIDYSAGFVAVENTWTDTEAHRDTGYYYMGEQIFFTSNHETGDGVINGTRGNILGAFIHPDTGWGTLVYQINTFYDWLPQVSGSVDFDYFIYSSGGIHLKLTSARADVTGVSSAGSGLIASMPAFYSATDEKAGAEQFGKIVISDAGAFSSDGSTNIINGSQYREIAYFSRDGTTESSFDIPVGDNGYIATDTGDPVYSSFEIYMKKR